jgi:hypothetical protein
MRLAFPKLRLGLICKLNRLLAQVKLAQAAINSVAAGFAENHWA